MSYEEDLQALQNGVLCPGTCKKKGYRIRGVLQPYNDFWQCLKCGDMFNLEPEIVNGVPVHPFPWTIGDHHPGERDPSYRIIFDADGAEVLAVFGDKKTSQFIAEKIIEGVT